MWDSKLPEQCDSESISLKNVGTIDAIDANLLDDFDYVALGHIHRPQKIKRETAKKDIQQMPVLSVSLNLYGI